MWLFRHKLILLSNFAPAITGKLTCIVNLILEIFFVFCVSLHSVKFCSIEVFLNPIWLRCRPRRWLNMWFDRVECCSSTLRFQSDYWWMQRFELCVLSCDSGSLMIYNILSTWYWLCIFHLAYFFFSYSALGVIAISFGSLHDRHIVLNLMLVLLVALCFWSPPVADSSVNFSGWQFCCSLCCRHN